MKKHSFFIVLLNVNKITKLIEYQFSQLAIVAMRVARKRKKERKFFLMEEEILI